MDLFTKEFSWNAMFFVLLTFVTYFVRLDQPRPQSNFNNSEDLFSRTLISLCSEKLDRSKYPQKLMSLNSNPEICEL